MGISAFGVLNAQLLGGPRLTWAMARDGQFFGSFAALDARFATPAPAILLLGGIATAFTLALGLERTDALTTGVVVVDATFFALTALALPVLRRRAGAHARGPGWIDGAAILFAILELMGIVGSLLQQNVRHGGDLRDRLDRGRRAHLDALLSPAWRAGNARRRITFREQALTPYLGTERTLLVDRRRSRCATIKQSRHHFSAVSVSVPASSASGAERGRRACSC